MRSNIKKLIAIALVVGMIACAGAGCGKKDDKKAESSTTSAQSTTESKTEESKTEESKTEESKTEESKTEESKTEESSEASSEQPSQASAYAAEDVAGTYVLGAGAEIVASFTLAVDGTASATNAEGETREGTWTMEGAVLTLVTGDTQLFTFDGTNLTSQENPAYVFTKATPEEKPAYTAEDVAGTYVLGAGAEIVASFTLAVDGTASATNAEGETREGTWTMEGAVLTLVTGDTQLFTFDGTNLTSQENPAYVFTKAAAPEQE